jgi:hypothetical protein
LCDETGKPKIKIHGFGIGNVKLLVKYPWYSVDSTSWVRHGGFGKVWFPAQKNNKFDFINGYGIICSIDTPIKNRNTQHFCGMNKQEKENAKRWLKKIKIPLGNLKQKEIKGLGEIEEKQITEIGILNYSYYRYVANIWYFIYLQNQINSMDIRFKRRKVKKLI